MIINTAIIELDGYVLRGGMFTPGDVTPHGQVRTVQYGSPREVRAAAAGLLNELGARSALMVCHGAPSSSGGWSVRGLGEDLPDTLDPLGIRLVSSLEVMERKADAVAADRALWKTHDHPPRSGAGKTLLVNVLQKQVQLVSIPGTGRKAAEVFPTAGYAMKRTFSIDDTYSTQGRRLIFRRDTPSYALDLTEYLVFLAMTLNCGRLLLAGLDESVLDSMRRHGLRGAFDRPYGVAPAVDRKDMEIAVWPPEAPMTVTMATASLSMV